MMMQLLAPVLGSVFWLSSASLASVSVQDNFLRTGQTESLIAPLTQFGGVTTNQKWSGLVEVILSGEAINNPPTGLHSDPFWAFFPSDPNTIQGTGTRFRILFTGCAASFALTPRNGGYALDATVMGTNFDGSELPLPLGLMIGDDAGTSLLTNGKLTAQSQ